MVRGIFTVAGFGTRMGLIFLNGISDGFLIDLLPQFLEPRLHLGRVGAANLCVAGHAQQPYNEIESKSSSSAKIRIKAQAMLFLLPAKFPGESFHLFLQRGDTVGLLSM